MDEKLTKDEDSVWRIADDLSRMILQIYSQSDYSTKNSEDDWDTEMEDFLLGMKDSEGNLRPNDDEYDLTEEQENYLLRLDCPEHYIYIGGSSDTNEYHAMDVTDHMIPDEELFFIDVTPSPFNVDDDEKLFFIDKTPSLTNENDVYKISEESFSRFTEYKRSQTTMQAPPPCSSVISGRTGRITYPMDDSGSAEQCTFKITKSEAQACAVQLDFSSFDVTPSAGCERNYLQLPNGQRLCGTLGGSRKTFQYSPGSDELALEFVSTTENDNAFDIQVSQLPGPCDYESAFNRTGRILQQCDQTIKATSGRITSPGFPGAFGPNYRCTYKIFRPDPSVCQIELEFLTFNLGKHNVPGCHSGAFLELPGKNRLCHDLSGKMIIKVSEFKDPVVFHFQSDSHTSGRGFEIIANQIPNTCPGYDDHPDIPNSIRRCYQEVTSHSGYFSSSNIRFHFPLGMPMWCEFVVRRADPTVCRIKLQITAKSFLNLPCINNFIHLPNGERMCVSVTERRELWIPDNSKYITMVYYNTNNPEFNLSVDQVSNSCKSENTQNHKSIIRRWVWNVTPR